VPGAALPAPVPLDALVEPAPDPVDAAVLPAPELDEDPFSGFFTPPLVPAVGAPVVLAAGSLQAATPPASAVARQRTAGTRPSFNWDLVDMFRTPSAVDSAVEDSLGTADPYSQ
jgi:hypothetical protein